MKFLLLLLLIPFFIIPVFAESQILSTDKGTLDIKLSYEDIKTSELTRLPIEFINPMTQKTQVHIDYKIMITESGKTIFQTPNLIHTSEGIINGFKFEFPKDGTYNMKIDVEGILFTPITPETVSFDIIVGESSAQPINPIDQIVEETVVATQESEEQGGGCLIATATYGTELAPQVQLLREIRDNQLLNTESGSAFMKTFNEFYYSFSPTIADYERENPVFKEAVKIAITPIISSLSILNYVDMDSEVSVLGYGISLIILNIGMYFVAPGIVIHSIRKKFHY